jgi:hypothetical protein
MAAAAVDFDAGAPIPVVIAREGIAKTVPNEGRERQLPSEDWSRADLFYNAFRTKEGAVGERMAKCGCDQLSVTVTGEPDVFVMCNCNAGRRRSGSQFGSGAFFQRANATTHGDDKSYTRIGDSGKNATSYFCPTCGTNIAWEAEVRPGWIGVAVGAVAGLSCPPPTVVLYDDRRHSWVAPPANAGLAPGAVLANGLEDSGGHKARPLPVIPRQPGALRQVAVQRR